MNASSLGQLREAPAHHGPGARHMLGPGQTVAQRFEIERLVGAGGMGAVYRAFDRLEGATVALKVLLGAAHGKPEARARFVREARVLAELRHPGIVRYVDNGATSSDELYLVMEWLEGEELRDRCGRGPLSVHEGIDLVHRIAEALAAAHASGVVHRDLKPSNLFLPGGDPFRVKILDFGIARWGEASRALTRTGMALGTPGYMSPEQCRGEPVDARTDVFALGAIWYECLTGRPAFVGEHAMALLCKVLLEDPPPLRELRPEVPGAVEALVSRMLSKEPDCRPRDGAEVLEALDALGERLARGPEAAAVAGPSLVPHSAAPRPSLTSAERRFVSIVVVARAPEDVALAATALPETGVGPLAARLDELGARAEALRDGSLVAILHARGSATDLAHAPRGPRSSSAASSRAPRSGSRPGARSSPNGSRSAK